MSIVRQGTLPVGSLDHAITLNVQSSGGSHFETVTDTTPYLHRASPQDVASSMKLKKVVGGTIAWSQMWNADSEVTATAGTINNVCVHYDSFVAGHKYLATYIQKNSMGSNTRNTLAYYDGTNHYQSSSTNRNLTAGNYNWMFSASTSKTNGSIWIWCHTPDVDVTYANPQLFDLTQMFGSTIADYIYSLEQAHAGDGVAWFKALFGEDYYPYNAGELLSVKTSARKTYNADNVEIGSYALDDALELRGIPKLDGNNELYYDGDTYASDGTVTRKFGTVTFDGSETWYYDSNNALAYTIVTNGIIISSQTQHNVYVANDNASLMSESWAGRSLADGTIGMYYGQTRIFVKKSTITSFAEAKAYFTSNPTNVIYALETPTTESADAYTESQRVGATEEFVDGRTVEMPVGNVSEYKRLIQGD